MAKARRGRGEGGVRQRADGLWVGAASLGHKPDGTRIRRYAYGRTKAECQAKLRELLAAGPGSATASSVELGTYLARWLAADATQSSGRTHENRERAVRLHLTPQLGNVKLSALTVAHVKALYASLYEAGVGPGAVRLAAATLSIALSAARDERLIPTNPVADAPKPRSSSREMLTLTASQAAAVLAVGEGRGIGCLLHAALGTGLRCGELLALKWSDIDLDGPTPTLTVKRTLTRVGGKNLVKEPKSQAGRRSVAIPAHAANALRKHREAWRTAGHAEGVPVFCTRSGGYMSRSNVLRAFRAVAAKVEGVPKAVRFHDLRHTHASLLLSAGASLKAVSRRLGHANPAMTLRVYAHCLPGDDLALADSFGRIVGGS